MGYSINLSEDGKYIITKHWGDLTSEMVLQRTVEAHALGEKLGISLHLMDVTESRNVDSVFRSFKLANDEIPNFPGISMRVRVAVLVSPEDHSHDFIETLTRNAGQDLTIFRERAAAVRHLLAGS